MRILANTLAAIALAVAPRMALAEESTPVEAPARPAATIADMAWLEGEWVGTGIGGNPAGEAFSFAGDQQMVGYFWQTNSEGGIEFYELITVTPDGDSLIMRLKHFMGDLTGWEEKAGDTAVEFPLLERREGFWKFGPATFTKPDPNRLNVTVKIRQADGSIGSLNFSYRRAGHE